LTNLYNFGILFILDSWVDMYSFTSSAHQLDALLDTNRYLRLAESYRLDTCYYYTTNGPCNIYVTISKQFDTMRVLALQTDTQCPPLNGTCAKTLDCSELHPFDVPTLTDL